LRKREISDRNKRQGRYFANSGGWRRRKNRSPSERLKAVIFPWGKYTFSGKKRERGKKGASSILKILGERAPKEPGLTGKRASF